MAERAGKLEIVKKRSLSVTAVQSCSMDEIFSLSRTVQAELKGSGSIGIVRTATRGLTATEKSKIPVFFAVVPKLFQRNLWTTAHEDSNLITKLNGAWRAGFDADVSAGASLEQGMLVAADKFKIGEQELHNPLLHVTECYYKGSELILKFVLYGDEPELSNTVEDLQEQARYADMVEKIEVPYGDDIYQDHSPDYRNTITLKIGENFLQDRWIGYWQCFQEEFDYERDPENSQMVKVRMKFGTT